MKFIKLLPCAGFVLLLSACDGKVEDSPQGSSQITGAGTDPGTIAAGAILFQNKLCFACHGNDASGGASGIAIAGKTASQIMNTMASQLVHSGIVLGEQEANLITAFLVAPTTVSAPAAVDFSQPEVCATCHPRQFKEWEGSMMRYGAISPVFAALELFLNKMPSAAHPEGTLAAGRLPTLTDPNTGEIIPDRPGDLLCQSCHNPIDAARPYPAPGLSIFEIDSNENPFPVMHAENDSTPNNVRPLRDFATPLGRNGISCDFCHQVTGPNFDVVPPVRSGDGIANVSINFQGGIAKQGVLGATRPNPIHTTVINSYLTTSDFCGGCHDVRLGKDDQGTPEADAQRLENLFTEWQQGPYGPAPNGNNTTCQDCHMSIYPWAPPGFYPMNIVSVYPTPSANIRRQVSTHNFTGVDVALIDDYPGQEPAGTNGYGLPIGQIDRRDALLKAAATMQVNAPASIAAGGILSVAVGVTNVGAGHNIPSGFSQERQMWIELTVTDGNGADIYKSGYLVDSAHAETGELIPDGSLDDEDLQNYSVTLDPVTGKNVELIHGPDYNERSSGVNLGLVNFGNEFISYDDTTGEEVEEFLPFAAEHMNNNISIPPLQTHTNTYDIQLPAGVQGPVTVRARLLFRAFPPRFLRFLAQQTEQFNLIDEAMVDRNRIVEMVGPQIATVAVTP